MPEPNSQSSRRRQREQAEPDKIQNLETAVKPAAAPVPLDTMLGQGYPVKVSGSTYEMAPLTLGKMREAQDLLARWPQVIFFAGFTEPASDSDIDAGKVAEMLTAVNAKLDDEAEPVTAEDVYQALAHLSTTIDEDEIRAMGELIALSLRRRHPDVTAEMIIDDLDIPTALRMLRTFFAVNTGLRDRFGKP